MLPNNNIPENNYNNKISIDNNNVNLTIPKEDPKEKEETFILYSHYGYIRVPVKEINDKNISVYKFFQYKQTSNSISINNNSNPTPSFLCGSINKSSTKSNIDIRIKSLTDDRKLYEIKNQNIGCSLNTLIEKMIEINNKSNSNDNKNNNNNKLSRLSQFRLFSSRYGIRELNTNQNFYENNIEDNELLIYLAELKLEFSLTMKGKDIEITPDKKTALKMDIDEPQYALGNQGYSSGRHYFEVTLLTEPMEFSIIVGVCTRNSDDEKNMKLDIKNFYGYILSEGKKTNVLGMGNSRGINDNEMVNYGEICEIKDNIGVLVEFEFNGVYVTFYRNKINLGKAFCNLPKNKKYYPAVKLGLCGSQVKINNDCCFPE